MIQYLPEGFPESVIAQVRQCKKTVAYQTAIKGSVLFYTRVYIWYYPEMATTKMKPFVMKIDPFPGFRNLMIAVLRNRIFLLFLILDLLVLGLSWKYPRLALSPVFYSGFAFAGFVWSAFQAYRDLSLAYRNILVAKPVEIISRSELSITFLTGNEYAYAIADPYAGQNRHITTMQKTRGVKCRFDGRGVFYINDEVYYCMSKASLRINIRIENSGDLPLEFVAVRLGNDLDLNYLKFFKDEVSLHGKKLCLPCPLQSGEFVLLQATYEISASKDSNNDLFAADFQALPRSILHELAFDIRDAHGSEQTYISKIETPSKPLIDLYVKQWREYAQEEYLFYAGRSSLSKPSPLAET